MKDYKKMMGVKAGKVMKNHGNTSAIKPDNQKYDMGRCQKIGHEKKGYAEKAFEYKY
jgi:hypothetical protein